MNDPFYDKLRSEMALRARLLAAGRRTKSGQLLPDDLVQEAMAKLLTAYGDEGLRARGHDQLMSLAYRTMRNLVLDQGRKKGAYLDADPQEGGRQRAALPAVSPLADELSDAKTRSARVRDAVAGLSADEQCFLMKVLETDSVPKAQKLCGWPPKSPYYQLRRLFSDLRDVLGPALGRG